MKKYVYCLNHGGGNIKVEIQSVLQVLQERKKYLETLSGQIQDHLSTFPAGTLRISNSYGRAQYYHRQNISDRGGKYLPRAEEALARQLAQKSYETQVLDSAAEEIAAINSFEELLPKIFAEGLYEELSRQRQALVRPLFETDENFINKWNQKPYKGKEMSPEIPELLTDRGERVRSKSEVIIANLLEKEGVPYKYECPVELRNHKKFYPDFTVLNIRRRKEFFWEHLGMMDNPEYAENAIRKISVYIRNGIVPGKDLIISAETKNTPLNIRDIRGIISHYLL